MQNERKISKNFDFTTRTQWVEEKKSEVAKWKKYIKYIGHNEFIKNLKSQNKRKIINIFDFKTRTQWVEEKI